MGIPLNQILVAVLAGLIILSATFLAAWGIADWRDVYTLYLVILSGLGFLSAGVFYGEARAYREAFLRVSGEKK
jgi:membrane protease YdiL (CAAX protease family)